MLPTKKERDHHKRVSLKLYEVMEYVGIHDEARKLNTKTATLKEIGMTIHMEPISVYISGSLYEGTTLYGLKPDCDRLLVSHKMPVVTKIVDLSHLCRLLLVPDRYPSYVKLQLVSGGRETYMASTVYLNQNYFSHHLTYKYRKGPAFRESRIGLLAHFDSVHAFKCEAWPECASEWLIRQREHGWPSSDLIAKCKSLGFLLVPASHPDSDEKEHQWRISFTLQERLLVINFNSVQVKCYILLKIITKEIVNLKIKVKH